jgi:hypothetical protein
MGMDYDATLMVGFGFSSADMEAAFVSRQEKLTKHVIKYDPDTGQPYIKEVVEREAGEFVIIDGEDLTGDPLQLIDVVVARLTAEVVFPVEYSTGGSYYEGDFVFAVAPLWASSPDTDEGVDPRQFGDHDYIARCAQLDRALDKMGIKHSPFRVWASLIIS